MTSASDNAGAKEYPAPSVEQGTATEQSVPDAAAATTPAAPQEHGGRTGPDPTRYGDWEKGGRCIDF